jgi:hypothetical protein
MLIHCCQCTASGWLPCSCGYFSSFSTALAALPAAPDGSSSRTLICHFLPRSCLARVLTIARTQSLRRNISRSVSKVTGVGFSRPRTRSTAAVMLTCLDRTRLATSLA